MSRGAASRASLTKQLTRSSVPWREPRQRASCESRSRYRTTSNSDATSVGKSSWHSFPSCIEALQASCTHSLACTLNMVADALVYHPVVAHYQRFVATTGQAPPARAPRALLIACSWTRQGSPNNPICLPLPRLVHLPHE